MSNKHFCQGPDCHTKTTQDRFLKSRGVVRGRYAMFNLEQSKMYCGRGKYFCSTRCESDWLDVQMDNIEHGRPIEFIRHRRESGGYEKRTETSDDYFGRPYSRTSIQRINGTDN